MKKKLMILLVALMSIGQVFAAEGTAKIIMFRPFSSSTSAFTLKKKIQKLFNSFLKAEYGAHQSS